MSNFYTFETENTLLYKYQHKIICENNTYLYMYKLFYIPILKTQFRISMYSIFNKFNQILVVKELIIEIKKELN